MDKAKGVIKGGWHPAGDRSIHRDSWKTDLKGIAQRKNPEKEKVASAKDHQSAPLTALRDPDSFGPPPRHSGASAVVPVSPVTSTSANSPLTTRPRPPPPGGLGGPVPEPRWRQEQRDEEEKPPAPPVPYRQDTSGLSTNNLPKPPTRRQNSSGAMAPPPPPRVASPATTAYTPRAQAPPPQPAQTRPMPSLPPRMNEHPDEYTPAPPPAYNEATQPAASNPAVLNAGALNRLGQAGISVPGFGIGNKTPTPSATTATPATSSTPPMPANPVQTFRTARTLHGQLGGGTNGAPRANPVQTFNTARDLHGQLGSPSLSQTAAAAQRVQGQASQVSELQQRFGRLNPGSESAAAPAVPAAVAAAQKKPPPPPPPPKKAALSSGGAPDGMAQPPPLPLSSKPRPP